MEWLALLPHSRGFWVWNCWLTGVFLADYGSLCKVCMFPFRVLQFYPIVQRHAVWINWLLYIVHRCKCECKWLFVSVLALQNSRVYPSSHLKSAGIDSSIRISYILSYIGCISSIKHVNNPVRYSRLKWKWFRMDCFKAFVKKKKMQWVSHIVPEGQWRPSVVMIASLDHGFWQAVLSWAVMFHKLQNINISLSVFCPPLIHYSWLICVPFNKLLLKQGTKQCCISFSASFSPMTKTFI